ncbi:hypothetical protein D047_1571A, partial [Vibrio parahaemolyticus VPTS-2010_2]
MGDANN